VPNRITFHYTLRDPLGRILDTSVGGEPVSFVPGLGQIIDGLDEALRGLVPGAKPKVRVPAARAYGERDPAQIQRVARAFIPVEGTLRVGDTFRAGDDPQAPVVTVLGVEGESVQLDANHPLAGVDLTFDVEIMSVCAATAEELPSSGSRCGEGCGCS
jgi:FKBP-type peptidyl-prolyl cis-trans isomerase SlyD